MERGITIADILPADAFFATRYVDGQRNFVTRRIYYNNGNVEAWDGKEWWTVCKLTPQKINKAMEAITMSGIMTAEDLSDASIYDTAVLTYCWRVQGNVGMVSNWIYPAREHPVFEILDQELDKLE
jgi:hypothetical protein